MSKKRKNAGEGYGYMFHGAFAKKADAVAKERKTKGAWIKGTLTNQGHRYIVMSPRTNPRRPNPSTRAWSKFTEAEKRELKRLGFKKSGFKTDADVQSAKQALERMEATRRGSNPSELMVMAANPSKRDRELVVPAGSTITIRVNPTNPPEHFTAGQARARGITRQLGGLIETPFQRRIAAIGRKASGSEAARLARSYKRHKSTPRNRGAEKVFHELYGRDNPAAICGHNVQGEPCTRKPGHKGPHLPQGATMRPRSRLRRTWQPRQPNPSAAALRESFTGSEANWVTIYNEPHMPAGDYAQLGELLALYVKPDSGGQVQQITFPKAARPTLVSDETARQIYFVDGDQDLSRSLAAFGAHSRGADRFDLGEARRIDYKQRKEHVPDPDLDEWRHEFGEENGIRPRLVYDAGTRRLLLEGGDYQIRTEGIVN